jgi:predicted nucleotidyltransferase
MDTVDCNWTALEHRLFSLLCLRAGEALSQREIALLLSVSPTAIGNSISKLLGVRFITVTKTKTINFVAFNRDEKTAIEFKRCLNLKIIYLSSLSDYLEVNLAGSTIILFGSYSRGEDVLGSDIDIAVIGRTEKKLDLVKFEKLFFRKININYYKTLKNVHVNMRGNICNGIVLHGSIVL